MALAAVTDALSPAEIAAVKSGYARAERRAKIRALLLVAPLFVFILVTFLLPIGSMLARSYQNDIVADTLVNTAPLLSQWDGENVPGDDVFAAMLADIRAGAEAKTITRLGQRLNYEVSGMSSLFRKTARRVRRVAADADAREALLGIDKKWGEVEVWRTIRRFLPRTTAGYYFGGFDLKFNPATDEFALRAEDRRIYLNLFGRTMALSFLITLLTFILGYPVAFLLAQLPTRIGNLLLILVLLPFWTSLLVRTTSWIVLLQQQGVVNDILVALSIVDESGRLRMMYNRTGTLAAMTHILLPFMILPLYSVMKTIPPTYLRAARSLGAAPAAAFLRVYFPNTAPGIGAGAILVFILSIGYYITPELVGGTSGTFISNRIAYHISSSLNWGLAAALGVMLLAVVLVLYYLYDKLVGIDNLKLG
jgi:putative spermidine/putrescine transport system permease protein